MQQSNSGQQKVVAFAAYFEVLEHVRILSGRASDLAGALAQAKEDRDALAARNAELEKQLNDQKSTKAQKPQKKEPVTLDGVAVVSDGGAQE